jgi:hypothetical protein
LRLIRELEQIAYTDVRDLVQWDREPELGGDGNLEGFKDVMKVTPSHLLTKGQASQVKSITAKSGGLKFEVHDKMAALAQLAHILGMTTEHTTQTVTSTQQRVVAASDFFNKIGREYALRERRLADRFATRGMRGRAVVQRSTCSDSFTASSASIPR